MLGLSFSSKLDWGSYIVFIAKTTSKRIGDLIRSMKIPSPDLIRSMKIPSSKVTLYFDKSTIRPCMEYFCHAWASAPVCYLDMLDTLQIQVRKTVSTLLAASCEPLSDLKNLASLNLIYRYYFSRCTSELVELIPLHCSRGRSTRYSDRLHNFSVIIPRRYNDFYVKSFFLRTAKL